MFHARLVVSLCIIPLEIALILGNVCHISEMLIYNVRIGNTVYPLFIINALCVV